MSVDSLNKAAANVPRDDSVQNSTSTPGASDIPSAKADAEAYSALRVIAQYRALAAILLGVLVFALFRIGSTVSVNIHRPDSSHPAQSANNNDAGSRHSEVTGLRLDPNTAAWWELAAIPGIGEVTAKSILDYRNSWAGDPALPFQTLRDLEKVKGIGPKTAKSMEPYLKF